MAYSHPRYLVEIRSTFSREHGLRYEVHRVHGLTSVLVAKNCKSYASARARATREVNRLNKLHGGDNA